MKPIVISVHSIIDVITNSSSEIYSIAHWQTHENVEKLINEILKLSGSKLKCKDLFDIEVKSWEPSEEDLKKYKQDSGLEDINDYEKDNMRYYCDGKSDTVIIKPKGTKDKKQQSDIGGIISCIFESRSCGNG